MIMPNDDNDRKSKTGNSVRKFNSILRAAQSHWGEFSYDGSNKIARGVLTTESHGTYIGELSYNDDKDHLFLTVRIAAGNLLAPARMWAFQRFTNNLISLGHVTLDGEDQIANVRAATAVSEVATQHAVQSIFAETLALLEDEDLHNLLR